MYINNNNEFVHKNHVHVWTIYFAPFWVFYLQKNNKHKYNSYFFWSFIKLDFATQDLYQMCTFLSICISVFNLLNIALLSHLSNRFAKYNIYTIIYRSGIALYIFPACLACFSNAKLMKTFIYTTGLVTHYYVEILCQWCSMDLLINNSQCQCKRMTTINYMYLPKLDVSMATLQLWSFFVVW